MAEKRDHLNAKARLKKLQTFHYFEKERHIESIGRAFVVLIIGLAFFFLSKLPTGNFRPLIVTYGKFFFRYSLFGNFFIILSLIKLYKIQPEGNFKTLLALYTGLFCLHGLSSALDPSGMFTTNVFLEILTACVPLFLGIYYLRNFKRQMLSFFSTLSIFLTVALVILFVCCYILGSLFIFSKIAMIRFLLWLRILETGGTLRTIHFLLGVLFVITFTLLYYNRKKLIKGFSALEEQLYLDK